MSGKHRLNLVLQPRPMPHELGAPGDLPSKGQRAVVGHPHLRQEAAGIELRQDGRINFVGLDPCFGDQANL